MTTNSDPSPKKRFPAIPIALTLLTLALIFYVIWRVDTEPGTDDAYAYADTIDVVAEVSGKIIDLPIEDNQAVKQGDLLFQIDPRPYQEALNAARATLVQLDKEIELTQRTVDAQKYGAAAAKAAAERPRAALVELDKQIELTQRTVNAQKYNAAAAKAAVERARAAADQATDTLRRMEPLLADGYVSAEEVDRAKTAQRSTQATLEDALLREKEAAAAVSSVEALVAQRAVVAAEIASANLRAKEAAAAVRSVEALVAQRAVVEAQIAIAELHLEFTTVRAPFDGRVVSLDTSEGQFASPLKPVCTLIDTRHWYVVANFRESELKNIYPGTHSTVYLMANTDEKFQGTVDSIGYGVHPDDGGSTLGGLPRVKRSINWVRVAQRFPVKILVEDPDPDLFRIGASAVVTLHPALRSPDRKPVKHTKATPPDAAPTKATLPNAAEGNNMDKQEQALRAALAQSEAPAVKREMDVLSITFKGDVSFDVDSAALKPDALGEINRVAGVLNQYPQTTILVAGHTDSTGAEDYNRRLSARRAESVKYALVSYGVSPMRVIPMGYGEDKSIATNDTSEGRQLNRRVEIRIKPQQQQ